MEKPKNTFKVYIVHDFFPILSCQAVGVENSSEDLVCHV